MPGIETLRGLLRRAPALRAPVEHEAASMTTAMIHMRTPVLHRIAQGDLRTALETAMADGGGILQMGLAPRDLEIDGPRFQARCDLRLDHDPRDYEIQITGDIDALGRVVPDHASLLGSRIPARRLA